MWSHFIYLLKCNVYVGTEEAVSLNPKVPCSSFPQPECRSVCNNSCSLWISARYCYSYCFCICSDIHISSYWNIFLSIGHCSIPESSFRSKRNFGFTEFFIPTNWKDVTNWERLWRVSSILLVSVFVSFVYRKKHRLIGLPLCHCVLCPSVETNYFSLNLVSTYHWRPPHPYYIQAIFWCDECDGKHTG